MLPPGDGQPPLPHSGYTLFQSPSHHNSQLPQIQGEVYFGSGFQRMVGRPKCRNTTVGGSAGRRAAHGAETGNRAKGGARAEMHPSRPVTPMTQPLTSPSSRQHIHGRVGQWAALWLLRSIMTQSASKSPASEHTGVNHNAGRGLSLCPEPWAAWNPVSTRFSHTANRA